MEEFESLSSKLKELGESEVRSRLANGSFGERKKPLVEEWLRSLEASRISASSAERSELEKRALEIAEEANSIARDAKAISERQASEAARASSAAREQARWAKWAAILAAIAAITANKEYIISFFLNG